MKNQKGFGLIEMLVIVFVLTALGGAGYFALSRNQNPEVEITSFQECVDAGNPIMESYPERCSVPGGETYVNPDQTVKNEPNLDIPQSRELILSKIQVEIINYSANNNGKVPANQSDLNDIYRDYLGCNNGGNWDTNTPTCGVDINDPVTNEPTKLLFADIDSEQIPAISEATAVYATPAICDNTTGSVNTSEATSRNFALWTYIDVESIQAYCLDNT